MVWFTKYVFDYILKLLASIYPMDSSPLNKPGTIMFSNSNIKVSGHFLSVKYKDQIL